MQPKSLILCWNIIQKKVPKQEGPWTSLETNQNAVPDFLAVKKWMWKSSNKCTRPSKNSAAKLETVIPKSSICWITMGRPQRKEVLYKPSSRIPHFLSFWWSIERTSVDLNIHLSSRNHLWRQIMKEGWKRAVSNSSKESINVHVLVLQSGFIWFFLKTNSSFIVFWIQFYDVAQFRLVWCFETPNCDRTDAAALLTLVLQWFLQSKKSWVISNSRGRCGLGGGIYNWGAKESWAVFGGWRWWCRRGSLDLEPGEREAVESFNTPSSSSTPSFITTTVTESSLIQISKQAPNSPRRGYRSNCVLLQSLWTRAPLLACSAHRWRATGSEDSQDSVPCGSQTLRLTQVAAAHLGIARQEL